MGPPFIWEEGACIYGTPRVHNNFPFGFITMIELDKTIKIYIAFYYLSDAIGPF